MHEALNAADAVAMIERWTETFDARMRSETVPKKPGADNILEMPLPTRNTHRTVDFNRQRQGKNGVAIGRPARLFSA